MSASHGRHLNVRSWYTRWMMACALFMVAFSLVPASSLNAQVETGADAPQAPRFFLAMSGRRPEPMDVSRVPMLRQRLALDLEGVTLKQAITAISRQSGLVIWYSDDILRRDTPVRLRAEAITVAAALTDVLMDAGVDVVFSRDGTASLVKRTAVAAPAQAGVIIGRVTDSTSREGVGGVTIAVEGTRLSATTGADGGYAIRGVAAGSRSITARRLGFVRQSHTVTVPDNESITVDFLLVPAPTTLSEVVTTATGDQRRVELGHVVGYINADSVVKAAPVWTLSDILAGRVAGVQVNSFQGTVGGNVSLQVRSPNTIQLSTEPIVIVDGVRYVSTAARRVGRSTSVNMVEPSSPLNDLNPNDIATIEVVKGPSAATLYGTDASNGVIVVTTKRGLPGRARWSGYVKSAVTEVPSHDYEEGYWGWHTEGGVPSLWSCSLLAVAFQACMQDSVTAIRSPLNDPQQTIFAAKPRWQYGASVSGGSRSLRFYAAGDIESATGPFRMPPAATDSVAAVRSLREEQLEPNAFGKSTLRANVAIRLRENAEIEVNSGYSQRHTRTLGASTPYFTALTSPSPQNPFGSSAGPAEYFSRTTIERTNRLFGSATAKWIATPWLVARVTGGVDMTDVTRSSFVGRAESPLAQFGEFSLGAIADDRGRQLAATGELGATATYSIGGVSSRTSIGAQYVRTLEDLLGSSGTDLPPGSFTIATAAVVRSDQNYRDQVTLGSYVEQVLGFKQRLYLTGALRADGASTFGKNYDATVYPKAGLSWLVSEERWMRPIPLLNELRMRYAFGASGQQPRPEWARPGYAVIDGFHEGKQVKAYTVTSLGNPALRPERVREHEFGFDAATLQQRMDLSLTWYRRKTVDQIVSVNLPPGLGPMQSNLGLTTGRGFEAQLSASVLQGRRFSWQISLLHGFHRTVLENLGGAVAQRSVDGGWVEGYPLGARFVRPLVGFDDANGDGIIDPFSEIEFGDTAVYAGESRAPRSQSLTSSAQFFDGRMRVSALVERRSGFTQVNHLHARLCGDLLCRAVVDPTTRLADQAHDGVYQFANVGSPESGAFTRFRELAIAFDLPTAVSRALRLTTSTVGLQGRNLALWTDYPGVDPESSDFDAPRELGIPQSRSWALRFDFIF